MNKLDIKKHLIEQAMTKVDQSEIYYTEYLCGSGRACDQVLDLGDEAQLNARNEISVKLDTQSQIYKKNLEFIKSISFKPSSSVTLGAIIETENIFLIIATSTKPFEYNNKQFVGISVKAPIYDCLKGKNIGEECIYNDVKFLIKNIY